MKSWQLKIGQAHDRVIYSIESGKAYIVEIDQDGFNKKK